MSGQVGPLTYTQTQVTVANTTTVIAAANEKRLYLCIQNVSSEEVDIMFGAAAEATKGFRLNPVAAGRLPAEFESSEGKGNLSRQAVNAICSSGSKNVNVISGE